MSHSPIPRIILGAAAISLAVLTLTSCTAVHAAPANSPTPHASASASAIDPHIALSCAVLGSMQTALEDAGIRRSQGEIDDSAYAAVLDTAPNTLSGLRRNPQAGMQSEVWDIQEAMKTSPPAVPHAAFDPHAGDFAAAMQQASSVCEKNQTKLVVYLPPGQG